LDVPKRNFSKILHPNYSDNGTLIKREGVRERGREGKVIGLGQKPHPITSTVQMVEFYTLLLRR